MNENLLKNLAEKYGTPLFVYDRKIIEDNYKRLQQAFTKHYNKFQICYAVKCNNNLALMHILAKLGAGFDCSSPGDIYLAKKTRSSFNIYTGNFNSEEEFSFAAKNKMRIINLDDIVSLKNLRSRPEILSFRINPGLHLKTSGATLSGKESKFGIPTNDLIPAYKKAKNLGIKHFGIHMMLATKILTPEHFEFVIEEIIKNVVKLKKQLDIDIEYLNMGGGLGIPYNKSEKPLNIELLAKKIIGILEQNLSRHKLKRPTLIIEPGRYLVGNAGYLLGKVQHVKKSYKNFIGTDIGVNSIMRVPLFNTSHNINFHPRRKTPGKKFSVCGQICWSGDVWAKDLRVAEPRPGDLVIVSDCGAYCYCFTNNFNSRLSAAEILVDGKESYIIRQREQLADLDRLINLPPNIKKNE